MINTIRLLKAICFSITVFIVVFWLVWPKNSNNFYFTKELRNIFLSKIYFSGHVKGQLVDSTGKPCALQRIVIFQIDDPCRGLGDCFTVGSSVRREIKIAEGKSDIDGRFDIIVPDRKRIYSFQVFSSVDGRPWLTYRGNQKYNINGSYLKV